MTSGRLYRSSASNSPISNTFAVTCRLTMELSAEQKELVRLNSRITKRFHKACAGYGLIADGDHILIGLSGGKDSLALVELLGKRARVHVPSFRVSAIHVRVKERDYLTDTGYLERFCAEYNVPLHVVDTQITDMPDKHQPKDPCFLCSWYRRKAMFDLAQELGCNKIALGHHQDDLVETFLMNILFQGAVATIPPVLHMDKMPITMIRPLCLIPEQDIARYAQLRNYQKQTKLCPFEHVSSRAKVKGLISQLQTLNPEVRETLYAAMGNIKNDYLPHLL